MSPFLEAETKLETAEDKRFITIGNRIYYSDSVEAADVVFEGHAKLAKKAGVTKVDENNRPVVDDGGYIEEINNKFAFGKSSITCKIKGNNVVAARNKTYAVAKSILGKDKVY